MLHKERRCATYLLLCKVVVTNLTHYGPIFKYILHNECSPLLFFKKNLYIKKHIFVWHPTSCRRGRNSKVSPNWPLDPFRASAEVRQFNPTPLHLHWHSWNSGSGGQRLEDPPLISPRAHSGAHCCAELLTAWAGSLDEMGREGATWCEAREEAAAAAAAGQNT